jgi:chemotaxis protein methyltransferase CheR
MRPRLEPFKSLVREQFGLSFDHSREPILTEGIRSRQDALGLASDEAYLELLTREPGEFNRLVNLVTVNETYFFREADHFAVLTDRLIPEIAAEAPGRRIRIVCAGCSSGEEPYTVAMALLARFGCDADRVASVIGFDIDEEALCRARAGVYDAHSFRGVPDDVRARFFDQDGRGWRIHDEVRRRVTFVRLNVLGDCYPDSVRDADVIFYRNVSIYFEPPARKNVLRNLAGLLAAKGYLFMSSTETFAHDTGVLTLVERNGIFLYTNGIDLRIEERRKQAGAAQRPAAAAPPGRDVSQRPGQPDPGQCRPPRPVRDETGAGARVTDEPHRVFDQALALAARRDYRGALPLAERAVSLEPSFAEASLLHAGILVELRKLDEAEAACRRGMALGGWCVEAPLLLGLITRAKGNLEEATRRFKEAVYIKPSSWLAHFFLGEVFRQEGDREQASREYHIVIELLDRPEPHEPPPLFLRFPFAPDQIAHLCRHHLSTIGRRGAR